ncbi:MAG: hypothetical protein K2I14_02850 [Eubacterium sp.]|nr:hypothetical protein [Eubacterium sp.]
MKKIKFNLVYADAWGNPIGWFEFKLDNKFELYYSLHKKHFQEEKRIRFSNTEIADWIEKFENLHIENWKSFCMNTWVAADGDILSSDYESYKFNGIKSAIYRSAYPRDLKEMLNLVTEIAPNFSIDEYLHELLKKTFINLKCLIKRTSNARPYNNVIIKQFVWDGFFVPKYESLHRKRSPSLLQGRLYFLTKSIDKRGYTVYTVYIQLTE